MQCCRVWVDREGDGSGDGGRRAGVTVKDTNRTLSIGIVGRFPDTPAGRNVYLAFLRSSSFMDR